jgi:hypothetical protein
MLINPNPRICSKCIKTYDLKSEHYNFLNFTSLSYVTFTLPDSGAWIKDCAHGDVVN